MKRTTMARPSTSAVPAMKGRPRSEAAPAEPVSNPDNISDAIRGAVAAAMQKALPQHYTPEFAANFANTMIAELSQANTRPLTAAERGTEWMLRWGCPGFCVVEHGHPQALDSHSTAPVETSLRTADLECSGYSDGTDNLPWLTAQTVVTNDQPQAFGRETSVWLGYGLHLAEISPAKARKALNDLRTFTVQLADVIEFAERVAADDFDGDPEIARLDEEARARRAGRA
ncbi:hypothetical protein [Streptomyces sp. NPDC088812]|uniref:hypothetical protein n=1 Tax=Streptomyces sp. NPDC088812 TaxID=3365905 RepID=UPI0038019027